MIPRQFLKHGFGITTVLIPIGFEQVTQVEEIEDDVHLLKLKPRIQGGQIAKGGGKKCLVPDLSPVSFLERGRVPLLK